MPRAAREQSPTDYYHIMMRGINKEKIFRNPYLKKHFLELLEIQSKEYQVSIIAYCIMDNHLHLVLKGELEEISTAIKRVNIRFAMRLNKDQDRVGHVFQDRFKSEIIYNDQQLLQVIRYVHNNPVKAKMVENPNDYKWSSFGLYKDGNTGILDKDAKEEILEIAGGIHNFSSFHEVEDYTEFLDTKEEINNNRMENAQKLIEDYRRENGIEKLGERENSSEHVENLVKLLLDKTKLSHRKIAGMLEVNSNLVHSISKKLKQE